MAVLWLTAALATIAFSLATTVRGETERTATANEGIQAYYLASGALERAKLWVLWGPAYMNPDGTSRYYTKGTRLLRFPFTKGDATVEVIPESSRLNVNNVRPEQLFQVILQVAQDAERAQVLTNAIVDWRTAAPSGPTAFDQVYQSMVPSFRARHASLEEIEELLLVRGMTPDLFYGGITRDAEGRLSTRPGLRDCLSVFGSSERVDINTAERPVLASLGLPPAVISRIIEIRQRTPIISAAQMGALQELLGPAAPRLSYGGGTIYTLRSTARLRHSDNTLSDLRRSVAATVKFMGPGSDPPAFTLRWYDQVWKGDDAQ